MVDKTRSESVGLNNKCAVKGSNFYCHSAPTGFELSVSKPNQFLFFMLPSFYFYFTISFQRHLPPSEPTASQASSEAKLIITSLVEARIIFCLFLSFVFFFFGTNSLTPIIMD